MRDIRRLEAALNSAPINAKRAIPFKVGEQVRILDMNRLGGAWSWPRVALDSERRIMVEVELLGRCRSGWRPRRSRRPEPLHFTSN
jgi:hypothetical protein